MNVSDSVKRAGIVAIFVAEAAVMAAVALAAPDLPREAVIVGDRAVVIEVEDQRAYRAFSISRVVTPMDGWVIVRADRGGAPGELIGIAPVTKGENRDVAVAVESPRDLPEAAFVSVVSDRGTRGGFEFTTGDSADSYSLGGGDSGGMMGGAAGDAPAMSAPMDWPLVDGGGRAVAEPFRITPFDVTHRLTEADIAGAFADGSGRAAQLSGIVAPEASWVVIVRVGRGPDDRNEVIGSARVPAGRTERVTVPMDEVTDGSEVSALLVADLGAQGKLEVDAADPTRSVDAPYIVRSWFVWKRVMPAR